MSKGLLAKCSTFVIIICTTLFATPVITNNVSCPPGWVFWGSNCYYFYGTTWKSWTWDDAQSKCVSQGGFYGYNSALTSIHSEEENSYIYVEILGMTPENYPYPVWIGFRSDDGWFRWIDGTEVNYTRWDKQAYQPGGGISPNCVIMRLQGAYIGSYGYWYDGYDCETWTGGTLTVCKTSTEPEIPPTDDCPPFWVSWGSHCYYFSDKKTDYLQTWYDAQSFCEEKTENSFNSTLASIHSREENNYISDTLTMLNLIGYVWIGLSEGTAETPFEQWTDGSALQYTNWLPGYPSYPSDNSSACGYMSVDGSRGSSQWGNIPCDSKGYRTTVCKGSKASI